MANRVIALVGMAGAGKSIAADYLVENGYQYLRFGQITLDLVREKGLELNEKSERTVRESIREEHGMGAFATLNLPKIEALLKQGNVVVDGLYSWTEYKILKQRFGDRISVVSVYAPPSLRYSRLESRQLDADDKDARNRPFSREEAMSRDASEIENIEKGGPIAMADYTLTNVGSLEDFRAQLVEMQNQLGS